MGYPNPEQYMKRFEAESTVTSPAEMSFIKFIRQETREYHTPISAQEFVKANIYNQETIVEDEKEVNQKIDELQEEGKWQYSGEKSQAITNLLYYLIGNKELLKPANTDWDIVVGPVLRYDDFKNGTDLVITLCNYDTNETIPIGIDTTTSTQSAEDKHDRVEKDIKEGHLRELNYYIDPSTNQPIGKQEMPLIIIGFESDDIELITNEWSRHKDGAIKRLDLENTIREAIVQQLQYQLDAINNLAPEGSRERLTNMLQNIIDIFILPKREKKE